MKCKNSMLILILIVFLFSITSVCASDLNDTIIASQDGALTELTDEKLEKSIDESQVIEETNNEETDDGTFTTLNSKIQNASDGATINLTNDYKNTDGFDARGIFISKNLTIDGKGFTIDANRQSSIFYVEKGTVLFKNITFVNASNNACYSYDIVNYTALNCKFIGNTASMGGAMEKGTAVNCVFENNTAINYGGAMDEGSAVNCTFTGNRVSGDGGGGAMYKGSAINCTFTSNTARDSSGAMYECFAINCTFTGNRVSGDGGAMYGGSAINCTFTSNTANYNGGAMYGGSAVNCIFENNTANKGGGMSGSVFYYTATADSCIFKTTSDTVEYTDIFSPTLTVNNFTSYYKSGEKLKFNLTAYSGMPIANGNISISVYKRDSSWFGNYSCLSGDAWAVDLPAGSYYAIYNTEYEYFTEIERTITIVPDTTFWALNQTINGNNKTEINLTSDYYFNRSYDTGFIGGIVINRLVTINGNGYTINAQGKAKVFNVQASNVTINNLTIENANYRGGNGGAIYFVDAGNVKNCNFTNNEASYGGAIFFKGSGNVENCNFVNNKATTNDGGAIYFIATGNVTNCNFTNNTAIEYHGKGGAICIYSGTVKNCNFDNNNASSNGGAVYFNSNSTVTNCNFINNKATSGNGGAIYFYQKNSYVADCIFVNNSAGNFSAVHLSPTGTISYCIFINNSADYGVVGNSVDAQEDTVIANNIFLNNNVMLNVIDFASNEKVNSDYNWFGNTADNYTSPVPSNTSNIWLFLNATATPNTIPVLGTSNIIFSLYAYNKKTGDVFYYNNTLLKPVNLTVSATNGDVDNTVRLGNAARYNATDSIGKDNVTAAIENVACTIELSIKHNPELSVFSQQVFYSNNTIITTSYNSSATGKVKIILKGKYYAHVFTGVDLNTTISLGKIVPDDYEVSVIYFGDESFAPCNATGHLEVYPAVYLSINITSDKDMYFIGDTVIWTITLHNLDYSLDATNVTMASLFSSKFVVIGAITNNGTYNLNEGVWQIGSMPKGSTATLNLFGYGNSAGNHILNEVAVVCDEDNLGDMFGYNYIDLVDLSPIEKTASNNKPYCGNEITYELTISNNAPINYTNTLTVVDSLPDGLEFVETVNITGADLISSEVNGQTITWNITNINSSTTAVITIKVKTTKAGSLTNNMTVIFGFNNNHTVNCTVDVQSKIKTELVADAVTTTYKENKNLVITLKDNKGNPISGAKITVNLNGAENYTTDKNGQVKVPTNDLTPNTYTAKITFNGNASHEKSQKEVKVTVNKIKTKLTAKSVTTTYKTNKNLVITLKDNNGNPISGAKITVNLNGAKNYTTDKNGQVKVSTKGLTSKKYTAKITFGGNDTYAKSTKNVKVIVNKLKTKLTAKSVTTTYKVNKNMVITLKDIKGKRLSGKKITVKLKGTKTYKTNKKGQVKIATKSLAPKAYKVKIKFKGDANYKASSKTAKITVKKPTKMKATSLTLVYKKYKYLFVPLKDSKGKGIPNVKVYITINGVTYPCKTNKKGKAKLIIRLKPKVYTAKIKFNGNSKYAKTTQSVKVTVKKATPKIIAKSKTFKKSVQTKKYTATLKDNVKKAIKKAKLTLKVGKKTFKAKTNKKGKATFKITWLNNKQTYSAVVKYKGNEYYKAVSKKVKIKIK